MEHPSLSDASSSQTPLRATFKLKLNGAPLAICTVGQAYQFISSLEKNGERLAVGIKSGLLDQTWQGHSLQRAGTSSIQIFNDFILRRNLPDEHQLIRERFGE